MRWVPVSRASSIRQIDSGHFNDASEVVRAGLRLLEDQEKVQSLKLAELKSAIQAGFASGPGVSAEGAFDRLEQKYTAMAANCG